MRILAIDVGYGNTKAVWGVTEGVQTQWSEIVFKSVAPRIWRDDEIHLNRLDRVPVTVDGNKYWCGPDACSTGVESGVIEQSIKNITTPEYQALIAAAWSYMLKDLGTLVQSVDMLVLGLPVSAFKAHRDELIKVCSKMFNVPLPYSVAQAHGKTEVSG